MRLTSAARPEALDLLPYYERSDGPLVRAGMVASVDGAAAHDGRTAGLSTPADRAVFRLLRALCDVVLVGAGTARAEDYGPPALAGDLVAWRRSAGLPVQPRLAVVTRSGELDPSARLFSGAPPLVLSAQSVATTLAERLADRAEVLALAVEPDEMTEPAGVRAIVEALHSRRLGQVLCEGGPSLLGDLLRAGLVDEVCCTVSPVLAGAAVQGMGMVAGALAGPLPLRLLHVVESDSSLLLRYEVVDGVVPRTPSRRSLPSG